MGDAEQVVAENQPADTVCVAVRSLISEGKRLSAKLEGCTENIASETETLADLEQQRTTREVVPNPRQLRDKLAALGPVLKQLDRRNEIEHTLVAEAKGIEGTAARLRPPVPDLGALARVSLPTAETIARFRSERDRIGTALQRAEEQAAGIADTITDVENRLQSSTAHGPVPSAEAIAAERQERDKAWVLLRDSMIGTAPALVGAALTGTILAFEHHSSEADRLADSALANAESVASYAADVHAPK